MAKKKIQDKPQNDFPQRAEATLVMINKAAKKHSVALLPIVRFPDGKITLMRKIALRLLQSSGAVTDLQIKDVKNG